MDQAINYISYLPTHSKFRKRHYNKTDINNIYMKTQPPYNIYIQNECQNYIWESFFFSVFLLIFLFFSKKKLLKKTWKKHFKSDTCSDALPRLASNKINKNNWKIKKLPTTKYSLSVFNTFWIWSRFLQTVNSFPRKSMKQADLSILDGKKRKKLASCTLNKYWRAE